MSRAETQANSRLLVKNNPSTISPTRMFYWGNSLTVYQEWRKRFLLFEPEFNMTLLLNLFEFCLAFPPPSLMKEKHTVLFVSTYMCSSSKPPLPHPTPTQSKLYQVLFTGTEQKSNHPSSYICSSHHFSHCPRVSKLLSYPLSMGWKFPVLGWTQPNT